jgi:hypothetical protein
MELKVRAWGWVTRQAPPGRLIAKTFFFSKAFSTNSDKISP